MDRITVKDLIDQLNQLPQDYEVFIQEDYYFSPFGNLDVDHKNKQVTFYSSC